MMLGFSTKTLSLTHLAEPVSMQNRVSLIVAFAVLAVVSCLLGTVLMPSSSSGGEKASPTQPVNYQAEEKTETPEQPKEEKEPAKIDTNIDTSDKSLVPIEPDMNCGEDLGRPCGRPVSLPMPCQRRSGAWPKPVGARRSDIVSPPTYIDSLRSANNPEWISEGVRSVERSIETAPHPRQVERTIPAPTVIDGA